MQRTQSCRNFRSKSRNGDTAGTATTMQTVVLHMRNPAETTWVQGSIPLHKEDKKKDAREGKMEHGFLLRDEMQMLCVVHKGYYASQQMISLIQM